ncbi:MAG TPA: ABC transporter permease [Anaerolineae bacterium]|nr:ABC transporter permease [Anaerolineae bacterium]HQI86755.1 ABC transporter permease [Anaerolineae bacterium]
MINYIIRRLLIVPFLLFGVTVLIFLMLMALSPVERTALYVRDVPRNERVLEGIIKKYGLDQPWYVQYWRWMFGTTVTTTENGVTTVERQGGILRGDLGYSRTASQPVAELLARRFPASLELTLYSVVPVIAGGILLGVIGAVKHNKPADHIVRVFGIVGWSFPDFVFGLLLLMAFYAGTGWFPPGRVSDWANKIIMSPEFRNYTSLITIDALLNFRLDIFLDALRHLVLPVITLAYLWWALTLRVTRSSMLETLRQDYITTARAKGLSERAVIRQHALPNALMPVVTLAGGTVVGLLSGVMIIETVYNFPGMGAAAVRAASQLDVITVLAFVLFNGLILVLANVVVDILYAYVDPRVRLD